jgi:UDP-3-O-[3-hydroxymyristoyl] N-acetylglucosamine deacetylase
MDFQRTLKDVVEFSGVALHSGTFVNIRLVPAKENTGVVFVRTDVSSKPQIPATWDNIVDTELSTVIGQKKGLRIATIEHLMSALMGMKIDNLIVEVNGPELPVLDGSSAYYVEAIRKTGIVVQNARVKYLQIVKPVSVNVDDKFIYFLPSSEFKVSCRVNYKHPLVGLQHFEYTTSSNYEDEVSKAKTFGFLRDVEVLQSKGLALGGSYDNALVLDDEKVVNQDIMSYTDEFVRHKVLDIMGDMALAGPCRILAHIVAYKSGHALHAMALKELFSRKTCFKFVEQPMEVDEKAYSEQALSILNTVPNTGS